MIKYNLFLDDFRIPQDAFNIWKDSDFLKLEWVTVRSHEDFIIYITTGLLEGKWPSIISFDHDLADEHYAIGEKKNYQYFDYSLITIPTGMQSAQWLVKFCKENNLQLPAFKVHSQSTIGKKNITKELESFNNPKKR